MIRVFAALLAAGSALLASGPAAAHPHVWIEASIVLHMKGGKITAVTHRWVFDPRFSMVLLDQFDTNRTRSFEKSEIAQVKANGFESLERLAYFTNIRIDGEFQPIRKIRDFHAGVENNSQVVYTFTIELEKAIDPRTTKADFLFLDRTYYVDVAVEKVALKGDNGCQTEWHKDKENPIYHGLVVPKMLNVTCAAG